MDHSPLGQTQEKLRRNLTEENEEQIKILLIYYSCLLPLGEKTPYAIFTESPLRNFLWRLKTDLFKNCIFLLNELRNLTKPKIKFLTKKKITKKTLPILTKKNCP